MDDKGLRLNSEVCSMPAADADRLLAAADGDCALLYIYLMRRGRGSDEELCRALGLTKRRLSSAVAKLRELGLASGGACASPPDDSLPEYTAEEVVRRSQSDSGFQAVLSECENILGRGLSGADTRTLLGIYDFLGLPTDVIMMLLHHCAEECRRRYGPGRVPTMRQIEKEAYIWVNREIMTLEQAEEYIRAREKLREGAEQLRIAFGIRDRQLVPGERRYIESWFEMGFSVEAIELAYDRTVTNTGQLKWSYMDSIIRSWHEQGLHTAREIEEKDAPRRRGGHTRGAQQSAPSSPNAEELERMRRLYDKLKNS